MISEEANGLEARRKSSGLGLSEADIAESDQASATSPQGREGDFQSDELEIGHGSIDKPGEIPLPPMDTGEFRRLAERVQAINADAIPEPLEEPSSEGSVDPEILEVFIEEAQGEVINIRENLLAWRENPDDGDALSSIRRSFHTLKGSGRMVEEFTIAEFAWCHEKLLNAVLEGRLGVSIQIVEAIDRAQEALGPLVGSGPADGYVPTELDILTDQVEALLLQGEMSADPDALAEPITEDDDGEEANPDLGISVTPAPGIVSLPTEQDREMIEVFLQEAAEILDASEIGLYRLSADPDNQELLNDFRREMHTLKGNARITGFMEIGDLAHAMESILERAANDEMLGDSAAIAMLQRALDGLTDMVARARDGGVVEPAEDLINDLHDLLTAESAGGGEPTGQETGRPELEVLSRAVSGNEPSATGVKPQDADEKPAAPDKELLEVFVREATEILNTCDVTLQSWSNQQENLDLLDDLRREMHTLKGSSRAAGFLRIGDLGHAIESLLDAIANRSLRVTPAAVDILQQAFDRLNGMVTQAQSGAELVAADDLITQFDSLFGVASTPPVNRSVAELPKRSAKPAGDVTSRASPEDSIRVSAALLNSLVNQMGESSIYRARIDQGVGALRFNLTELEQTIYRLRQQLRRLEIETEAQILFRYEEETSEYEEDFDPLELDRFSELQQLSRSLMEVVDDLTNIQNTLEDQTQDMNFLLDQQGKVNKEVQQGLMRTRMVRFSTVAPRLRRVVRQAAQELGKRAELILEETEAEVDRAVLENMVAPLEHMLRNSIAHGIETPESRRTSGKSEIGTIALTLDRDGAEQVITVSDDGAGINFEAIRAKGESKGLLSPGQPVTEQQLIALLLQPGFSTASEVTQVAGRGVGMDVLNDAIKEMRGALQVQSKSGEGACFIIRLPFSLALTQALLVEAAGETFAMPLLSIEAVTRLEEGEMQMYLAGESVKHAYNNRRYPVHSLGIVLGSSSGPAYRNSADVKPPVLLFRSGETSAALQVDAVLGNQEIIVKPVAPQIHAKQGISGVTVLGDGRVVVVLELAALVRSLDAQGQEVAEAKVLRGASEASQRNRTSAMVIDDSITMRKVTARFLERHNVDVSVAKDGVEAVSLLEEHQPDLVIMDIEMPRMDGFEVTAHIRNQAHLKNIPIIMVTSRSGEKHRERAKKLGVNDYLIKPYQEEALMKSIRKVMAEQGLKFEA